MEKTLQILIPLIHIQSNYFPLPVALIKAKALSQKLKYNEEALQPCFHATINFNVPHINRHESVSNYNTCEICISNYFICTFSYFTFFQVLLKRTELIIFCH